MTKIRTALALLLTLPAYLGCAMLPNHPFAAEWESYAKGLVGR